MTMILNRPATAAGYFRRTPKHEQNHAQQPSLADRTPKTPSRGPEEQGLSGFHRRSLALAVSGVLGLGFGSAQTAVAQSEESTDGPIMMDSIDVVDFRGEEMSSPRYTQDLLDTPRIISVLPSDLLEEQNITSMRDAMRNVPGISLQAGEGNPPGGDQLKIRGFNARADLNVDGVRSLGNFFRDPFYVEQIEVVKGPNSAFGGRGSAGGSVNFVTKQPKQDTFTRLETSVGTDNYTRATLDTNQTLNDKSAFRFNAMVHSADIPGRDKVNDQRWGFFGAYTWGFGGDTQVTADWLRTRQDNLEDKGLPFDREGVPVENVPGCADPDDNRVGRTGSQRCGDGFFTGELPPGIDFSSFFGHVDDFQKIEQDIVGLKLTHFVNNNFHIRNNFKYSLVRNDSITSSPRLIVPEEELTSGDFSNVLVRGDLKPRDQEDEGFFNQTDLVFNFKTGSITHDLVAGAELADYDIKNRRRPDVKGPPTDLFNPESRARPAAPFDGTVHRFEAEEQALYLLDTLKFNPKWQLNAGARWDRVEATVSDEGWEQIGLEPVNLSRTDKEWSYNLGLVYKPQPNASIYAAFGSAFEISGTFDRNQIQLAGGGSALEGKREQITTAELFDVPPEETETFEIGTKWRVLESLDINAALFRTEKDKARVPGLGRDDPSVLDTEQVVDGFELLITGNITPRWNVIGGYIFMDSEVEKSTAFPNLEGQELGGTPDHSFNLFTTYDVTPRLNLGVGFQYVDEQISAPQPVALENQPRRRNVSIDSYEVVDLYASYKLTDQAEIRVNIFNLFDDEHITQLAEGGAQGIPGKGRHGIATFRYNF